MFASSLILKRAAILAGCTCLTFGAQAGNWTAEFEAAVEARLYTHDVGFDDERQENFSSSLALEGEIVGDWQNGSLRLTLQPFVRGNQHDSERSHADLREASLLWLKGDWEVLAGISKTFWGALESAHLVDIINQTDNVENIDGEDKLGQPMLRVTRYLPFGAIEAYVMSGFRDRTYPGVVGRLRSPLAVDTDNPLFESADGREKIEYALRFSGNLGSLDYGISYFNGNGREPRLVTLCSAQPCTSPQQQPTSLVPLYEEVEQTSIDALWALGGWLLKAEVLYRVNRLESFMAGGLGAEYTFVGAYKGIDIGVLTEYLYDARDTEFSLLQSDLFAGARLVFNDQAGSELLIGVVQDLDDSSQFGLIEASRRLGDNFQIALEARWLRQFNVLSPLAKVQNDDYVQMELRWFF